MVDICLRSRPSHAARPACTWGVESTLVSRPGLVGSGSPRRPALPLSYLCASPVARPEHCTYSLALVPDSSPAASAPRPPPSSGPAPSGAEPELLGRGLSRKSGPQRCRPRFAGRTASAPAQKGRSQRRKRAVLNKGEGAIKKDVKLCN